MGDGTGNGVLDDVQPRTRADLVELRERAGLWQWLDRTVGHPLVFIGALVLAVIVGPLVLTGWFGVRHRLVGFPGAAVVVLNTAIVLVGVFYTDLKFQDKVFQIRDTFDLTDEEYYGFFYRMFDRLYTYSFFSPIVPGPSGRYTRPWLLAAHVGTFLGLFAFVGYWTPLLPADGTLANSLFLLYAAFLIGYGTTVVVTFSLFVAIVGWFLTHKAAALPVKIDFLHPTMASGLEPFGQFVFHTLLLGLLAVGVTGTLGFLGADPLLMLAALIITAILLPWFVASQYGFHKAITRAKQERLERLYAKHAAEFQQLISNRTPEPEFDTIEYSHSFLVLKREIEALPEWPVNAKTVRRAASATVLMNIPGVVGLLPYVPDLVAFFNGL